MNSESEAEFHKLAEEIEERATEAWNAAFRVWHKSNLPKDNYEAWLNGLIQIVLTERQALIVNGGH